MELFCIAVARETVALHRRNAIGYNKGSTRQGGDSKVGINEYLKKRRGELRYSLTDVTRLTGMPGSSVSRIESGEYSPSSAKLRLLAKAYKVSYVELMKMAGHLTDEDMKDILHSAGGLDFRYPMKAALMSRTA